MTEAEDGEARPLGESARAVLSRGAILSAIAEPPGRSAAMGAEADVRAVLGAWRLPPLAVSSGICAWRTPWPAAELVDEAADGSASFCARPRDAPSRAPLEGPAPLEEPPDGAPAELPLTKPPDGAPAEIPLTKPLGWPPGAREGADAPY